MYVLAVCLLLGCLSSSWLFIYRVTQDMQIQGDRDDLANKYRDTGTVSMQPLSTYATAKIRIIFTSVDGLAADAARHLRGDGRGGRRGSR